MAVDMTKKLPVSLRKRYADPNARRTATINYRKTA